MRTFTYLEYHGFNTGSYKEHNTIFIVNIEKCALLLQYNCSAWRPFKNDVAGVRMRGEGVGGGGRVGAEVLKISDKK